jgi:hypothetical protein
MERTAASAAACGVALRGAAAAASMAALKRPAASARLLRQRGASIPGARRGRFGRRRTGRSRISTGAGRRGRGRGGAARRWENWEKEKRGAVAAVCLLVFCGGPRFSLVKVEGGGSWAGEGPPSRWRSFFLLLPFFFWLTQKQWFGT